MHLRWGSLVLSPVMADQSDGARHLHLLRRIPHRSRLQPSLEWICTYLLLARSIPLAEPTLINQNSEQVSARN
jgi:hypothetical protein